MTEEKKTQKTEPAEAVLTIPKSTKVESSYTMVSGSHSHRRTQPLKLLLMAIVILTLGFGGGWLGAASHHDESTTVTQQKTVLTGQAALVSSIAKNVGQSVVSVDVTEDDGIFGGTAYSAGTGMILTSDGLIMTNRHVISSTATSVKVTLSDGTVYDNVKVIGRTNDGDSLDVAFLKIQDTKGKTLVPVKLGDSSAVKVGDPAVAIGNALGQFQNTVTSGIISGYGRSISIDSTSDTSGENLDDLFQTDAAINEGNSGGPLVNLNGEVIGMNTAAAEESQNVGFAIPINDLTGVIDSVKTTGKLIRPYLGVVYIPLTSDIAQELSLNVDRGAYIPHASDNNGSPTIVSGGPADAAGLQEGDVITKVGDASVNETTSLTSLLSKHKVGDTVTLTIVRDGKTITKDVTLGTAPTSN